MSADPSIDPALLAEVEHDLAELIEQNESLFVENAALIEENETLRAALARTAEQQMRILEKLRAVRKAHQPPSSPLRDWGDDDDG